MLTRDITYNFDDNSANNIPYTYILNTYIYRITFVDANNDPVDLSGYTFLSGGIGNLEDNTPLITLTDFQDTGLWSEASLANGKIVCKAQLIGTNILNDLASTSIKRYYLEIVGSDEAIVENNYNTLCQFPIYTRNTIWRP
jgi:hypothetical protein